jgi:hypothetical protein
MADPSLTNSATGNSATATTVATFGFTATAGRLIVVCVGSDDYKTGDPSGYTLSTGCSQQTFLGHYVWWKIAAGGETSVSYTIGSASKSAWLVAEFDNIDATPYDTSNGQFATSSVNSYSTPTVTPSTGRRLSLASIGGSSGTADFTAMTGWTNSYTNIASSFHSGSATRDIVSLAYLVLTGDGSTGTSSAATYNIFADSETGIIAVFKSATGGGGGNNTLAWITA